MCVYICVCVGVWADVWSVTHDSRLILFHESVPQKMQNTLNVRFISVNRKMFGFTMCTSFRAFFLRVCVQVCAFEVSRVCICVCGHLSLYSSPRDVTQLA